MLRSLRDDRGPQTADRRLNDDCGPQTADRRLNTEPMPVVHIPTRIPAVGGRRSAVGRLRLAFALLLALVGGPPGAHAQAVRTITLAEAVELARTQSVGVQTADLAVREREAAVSGARATGLPALSLYTTGGQRYGLGFDQTTGELTQTTTENIQIGAEARYTLFDGFERRATVAGARADLAASEQQQERARQTAVSDVLRAFYQTVVDESAVRIAEENLESERQQYDLIEAQIRAGSRPEVEILQQDERVATAELTVLQARRAQQISALRLVRLLALDPAEDYRFVAPAVLSSTVPTLDEQALIAQALDRRGDVRANAAALTAAEAGSRAARSGWYPSVSIVGGYGTSFTTSGEGNFGSQFGDNRGGSLGLQLGFPLLDQGTTRARARAADLRAERLRVEREDLRRGVALDVREAVADYRVLGEQVRVAERRLTAADAALAAETERYARGMTTLPAVAEVRARRFEAAVGLEQARYALAFQQALLDYRTGALDPAAPAFPAR